MKAFINGISAISPQNTFNSEEWLKEPVACQQVRFLKCIEPNYSEFIDPMTARRMSRIVKMGVSSAIKCLHDAAVEMPGAIITGTGLGCIEDTEKFLGSIFINKEQLLNPTPFIQSTHNTLAAAIALKLKCKNYNSTYVHRGFSFEHALIDAIMLLHEKSADNILVGGLDELTDNSFIITDRLGLWKKKPINSFSLLEHHSRGSLAGEGAAFFILGNQSKETSYACLSSPSLFYKPQHVTEVEKQLAVFLSREEKTLNDIDLVILGLNGDHIHDAIYYHFIENQFKNIPVAYYKHLCGEYDTSSAFALYFAALVIKKQELPVVACLNKLPDRKINNILIYNHLKNSNHVFFLISAC
jgi:3-oxoacyl-(acyl-carrier-protein) synthase